MHAYVNAQPYRPDGYCVTCQSRPGEDIYNAWHVTGEPPSATYEPCAWCASGGFGMPCPSHGADYQGALNPFRRPEKIVVQRPLVLVDITGGLETASYLYAGVGEPELRIFDFDDEMDEQGRLADDLDEMASLIRERADHPDDLWAAARYEAKAADVRYRLHDDGCATRCELTVGECRVLHSCAYCDSGD